MTSPVCPDFEMSENWVKIVHPRQKSFVKYAMVHLIHLQDPTIKGQMTFINCEIVHLSHPQYPTIKDTHSLKTHSR